MNILSFIIIGFILCILGYVLANIIYRNTNAYKNSIIDIRDYLEGVPDNLKIVNFGSTYSKFAFNSYRQLHLSGFNFALSRQSLEADFAIMKAYSSHMSDGCIVMICLSACATLYRYDMGIDNTCYYKILGRGINEYKLIDLLKSKLPLYPFKIKCFFKVIKDVPYLSDIVDSYPAVCTKGYVENKMIGLVNVWKKLFALPNLRCEEMSIINQERMDNNTLLLEKMIDYCQKQSWKPILVITPFSKYMNQLFSEGFTNATLTLRVNSAAQKHNIAVFDYQFNSVFQEDLSLFVDGGFCLNKRGSKKFMKMLFADMTENGIKANNSNLRENL